MTVENTPYGYSPSPVTSYAAAANDIPPPVAPPPISSYPLKFQITNENMMWLIGGMASAFAFSKFIKAGIFSKIGYYAGLGAVGLAVSDFIGIFSINDLKRMLPI